MNIRLGVVMRMVGMRGLGMWPLFALLLLPGCASVPVGESVYPLTRESVPTEFFEIIEQSVPIGDIHGTRITRKDGDT